MIRLTVNCKFYLEFRMQYFMYPDKYEKKWSAVYVPLNFEIPVSTGNGILRWNRNLQTLRAFLSEERGIDN